MVNLTNEWGMARKAIESLYEGMCDIYEYQEVLDEESQITSQKESLIIEGQPCRLSFSDAPAAIFLPEMMAKSQQKVKLFLAPEVAVPAGSRVKVTQNGITGDYACSGKPAVYRTHQEIVLELFRGWC